MGVLLLQLERGVGDARRRYKPGMAGRGERLREAHLVAGRAGDRVRIGERNRVDPRRWQRARTDRRGRPQSRLASVTPEQTSVDVVTIRPISRVRAFLIARRRGLGRGLPDLRAGRAWH